MFCLHEADPYPLSGDHYYLRLNSSSLHFHQHKQKPGFITPVCESIINVSSSHHRAALWNKQCCLFSFPAALRSDTPTLSRLTAPMPPIWAFQLSGGRRRAQLGLFWWAFLLRRAWILNLNHMQNDYRERERCCGAVGGGLKHTSDPSSVLKLVTSPQLLKTTVISPISYSWHLNNLTGIHTFKNIFGIWGLDWGWSKDKTGIVRNILHNFLTFYELNEVYTQRLIDNGNSVIHKLV